MTDHTLEVKVYGNSEEKIEMIKVITGMEIKRCIEAGTGLQINMKVFPGPEGISDLPPEEVSSVPPQTSEQNP